MIAKSMLSSSGMDVVTSTPMQLLLRLLGLAALASGCVGGDPSLGTASWNQQPSASDSLFTVAWAEHVGTQWTIHTFQFDQEVHCSARVDGGGLTAELSDVSGSTLGDAPVSNETLAPAFPGAHLKIGSIMYTSGAVTIEAVGPQISATFVVENTALGSTANGTFDATMCN